MPFLKITQDEKDKIEEDPKEFVQLIEDVCGDQKSQTIKVQTAKLLSDLCEYVDSLYPFVISFTLDTIDRALKDHIPTRLSFTANLTDGENTAVNEMEETKSEKKYPETMFTDIDLCQVIRNYNLKFGSVSEWIEVCLVTITVTSWQLPTHRDVSIQLDQMLQKNLPKLL